VLPDSDERWHFGRTLEGLAHLRRGFALLEAGALNNATADMAKTSEDDVTKTVAQQGFGLSEGEISHLIASKKGTLLMVSAKKINAAAPKSFDEVKADVKAHLGKELAADAAREGVHNQALGAALRDRADRLLASAVRVRTRVERTDRSRARGRFSVRRIGQDQDGTIAFGDARQGDGSRQVSPAAAQRVNQPHARSALGHVVFELVAGLDQVHTVSLGEVRGARVRHAGFGFVIR